MSLAPSATPRATSRTARRLLPLFACFALAAAALPAQTTTWLGTADTLWSDALNWSNGVPTPAMNVVIPAGTPNDVRVTSGAGCLALTINGGATVNIPTAVSLGVSAGLSNAGTIAGFGEVQMLGSTSNVAVTSASPLSRVRISKTGNATVALVGPLTIATLTQVAGVTFVYNAVSITQNATFLGGSTGDGNGATLTVVNMTLANTTVAGSAPNTTCSGDWTADAAYLPPANTVTFSPGTHTLGGTPHFAYVVVPASTSVTLSGSAAEVGIDLTVAGTLSIASTVNVGRTATITGATTGAGNLGLTGSVYDGAVIGAGSIGHLVSAKTGGRSCFLLGTQAAGGTTCGTLNLTSGTLYIGSNGTGTTNVTGTSIFSGGTLAGNAGILNLNGEAVFSGTAASANPIINCAGHWTADAAFAPVDGVVTFTGTNKLITGTLPSFCDMVVAAGASITASGPLNVYRDLSVPVNGTLSVGVNGTIGRNLIVNGTIGGAGRLSFTGAAFEGELVGGGQANNI